MDGAKVNYLGLKNLIRLNQYVAYLSFLGGEAQRPYLQIFSSAVFKEHNHNKDLCTNFVPFKTLLSHKMFPPPR